MFVAPTISFGESAYTVDEHDGPALLAVVLSNPSSTDITINVVTTDASATGNCLRTTIVYLTSSILLQEEIYIMALGYLLFLVVYYQPVKHMHVNHCYISNILQEKMGITLLDHIVSQSQLEGPLLCLVFQ